jgi:transposase
MSLHAHPLEPIPELTRRIARASFPKGTLAMRLRDALGPIYEDADFAQLFAKRGRAAEAPWRLALVTVEARAGKPLRPPGCGDGSGPLGWEICAVLAPG